MAADIVQQIMALVVGGLSTGFLMALLGLSITLVFGLGGVLNLSLGNFAVIAATATVVLLGMTGSLLIGAVGGLLISAVLGIFVDRSLLSLVYRSTGEQRTLVGIFTMLGLSIVLDGFMYVYYPSQYSVPLNAPSLDFGGVTFRGSSLVIIAISVLLIGILYTFFERTYLGGATQTIMQDETGALVCGINPRRMRTLVFIISIAIASIAGILYAASGSVTPASSFRLTIQALIVSIAGGVTSISGTIAAGLLLGIVSTVAASVIGSSWSSVVLFGVVLSVIFVRPGDIA